MTAPAIVLKTILNNPALPQVPFGSISNLPEFESDASDHWVFDKGDARNYVGRVARTSLIPAGAAPTFNANNMVPPDTGKNGFISPFPDASIITMCGVFKRRSDMVVAMPLMGAMTLTAGDGGSIAYDQVGAPGVIAMQTRPGATVTVTGSSTGAIAAGTWYFAALVNSGVNQLYYVGGVAPKVDVTAAKVVGARNVAVGNGYIVNASYQQNAALAEFMVFGGVAKTAAELGEIYARSKVRMARRGITLY